MMRRHPSASERGSTLIAVILIVTFLLAIGVALLTVTGTGPAVSGNVRTQEQAFNAAEAGFDQAWASMEQSFADSLWSSFDQHYLREPAGIDLGTDALYFRKLTDSEIFGYLDPNGDGTPDVQNVLYYQQTYARNESGQIDPRYTFTVFLIDDEAGGGAYDPSDALLVCIGCVRTGDRITTSRLEIILALQLEGT